MDLNKYITAQKESINTVKKELRKGKKESHWIWFIFPQLRGLGKSYLSYYYGLANMQEASEYYNNKYLNKNLKFCFNKIMKYDELETCFGGIDTKKIHSCATLFYLATKNELFRKVIDKFFKGRLDEKTMLLLKKKGEID